MRHGETQRPAPICQTAPQNSQPRDSALATKKIHDYAMGREKPGHSDAVAVAQRIPKDSACVHASSATSEKPRSNTEPLPMMYMRQYLVLDARDPVQATAGSTRVYVITASKANRRAKRHEGV